jgi:hypothetical protein
VKEGKWNGRYVVLRPDQHKGKRAKSDAAPAANLAKDTLKQENKSGGTAADLQLQSKLKTVMCTNLCMSSEDVDRLFEEAKKLEGPERKGWHKVGFILCFLLIATFRLAQTLLINPADSRNAPYGLAMMDMATSTYSAVIHASMTCWTTVIFCL